MFVGGSRERTGNPMTTPLIYMAHPYGGDLGNLEDAMRRLKKLNRAEEYFDDLNPWFWAPWIDLCLTRPDSPEERERGQRFDLQAVELSHGVLSFDLDVKSTGCRMECTTAAALGIPVLRLPQRIDLEFCEQEVLDRVERFVDECREYAERRERK